MTKGWMDPTTRLTPIQEVRNAQTSGKSFSQSSYFSGLLSTVDGTGGLDSNRAPELG